MSDFEKKVLEFKNRLNNTQDSKEIESIRTDIFSKNGFIKSNTKAEKKRIFILLKDLPETFAKERHENIKTALETLGDMPVIRA